MVEGENIDEVTILLPEDKIQVCTLIVDFFYLDVVLHLSPKNADKWRKK